MKLPLYQIDAFANNIFAGNPAAVCPLDDWLADELMQAIAAENNLSETAFFVREGANYHIRWFTPKTEVDLCGHATLASAYVIFTFLAYAEEVICFTSKSGNLMVKKQGDDIAMDFPAQVPIECETPPAIIEAFAVKPIACLQGKDYIVVFDNEQDVLNASPDLQKLRTADRRCVIIITAKSSRYDFVNRCFAPKYGIDEDPVTGSSFTQLTPYWAQQLGVNELKAKQVSARGGEVNCVLSGDRVIISGKAAHYMTATIEIG